MASATAAKTGYSSSVSEICPTSPSLGDLSQYFLVGVLTPLLVGDGQPPKLPTADELVAAWTAQFISAAPAADSLRHSQVWLAAADFLTYLEMELQF